MITVTKSWETAFKGLLSNTKFWTFKAKTWVTVTSRATYYNAAIGKAARNAAPSLNRTRRKLIRQRLQQQQKRRYAMRLAKCKNARLKTKEPCWNGQRTALFPFVQDALSMAIAMFAPRRKIGWVGSSNRRMQNRQASSNLCCEKTCS